MVSWNSQYHGFLWVDGFYYNSMCRDWWTQYEQPLWGGVKIFDTAKTVGSSIKENPFRGFGSVYVNRGIHSFFVQGGGQCLKSKSVHNFIWKPWLLPTDPGLEIQTAGLIIIGNTEIKTRHWMPPLSFSVVIKCPQGFAQGPCRTIGYGDAFRSEMLVAPAGTISLSLGTHQPWLALDEQRWYDT